ncbi:MAG: response regulator transcription factor [Acidimicrobiia bacterium]|nr:response regulator transcription factor [Acidimicrobiia bacterium]MDH5503116.1 response regulator transcription factor [Acidimicrobiia bacterium]
MMKTVLVVDDELKITRLLRDYLQQAGFSVLTAADGPSALAVARHEHPDMIVLDLGLPGLDGLDVTRALRTSSDVPIIMLTARADESDRIVGLELGADDYLVKPFSPKELVARVRAVLRRVDASVEVPELVRAAGVTIDTAKRSVSVDGRSVDLTPTEYDLLLHFVRSPGRVFTRSQLLDAIHGVAFESYERAIDAHVKNLRRKLEADPANPTRLLTVYGVGYRYADA